MRLAPLAAIALGMSLPPAFAEETYTCELGMETAKVRLAPESNTYVFTSSVGDISLEPQEDGQYISRRLSITFEVGVEDPPTDKTPRQGVGPTRPTFTQGPHLRLGSSIFPCTFALPDETPYASPALKDIAPEPQPQPPAPSVDSPPSSREEPTRPQFHILTNIGGRSLGAAVYDGPASYYARLGYVEKQTGVTIFGRVRLPLGGYDWFEVVADNGLRGYMWGGLLCSEGLQVNGLFEICRGSHPPPVPEPEPTPEPLVQKPLAWSAYAIGRNQTFGHGRGPTKAEAERAALRFCGSSDCIIADVTNSACHALAFSNTPPLIKGMEDAPPGVVWGAPHTRSDHKPTSPGDDAWFGQGPDRDTARQTALVTCARQSSIEGVNTCRLADSSCRQPE